MKSLLLLLFAFTALATNPVPDKEMILGKWKLYSYDAIDAIRTSAAYQSASAYERSLMEEQFHAALNYTYYTFSEDSLVYTTFKPPGTRILTRKAGWTLDKQVISIVEDEAIYNRKILVASVSADTLQLMPLIEGSAPSSTMVFVRVKE